MSEPISELIDGRGHPAQRHDLFDHIIADRAAGLAWRHYHLIGCVLRGEVAHGCGADLSAQIAARIEAEPEMAAAVESSVVALKPRRRRTRRWQPAAALALAASLALVAVIVMQPGANQTDSGAPIAQTTPAPAVPATPAAPAIVPARFVREFNEMLAQHGEFASAPGLNGLIVHAKLVNNQPLDR